MANKLLGQHFLKDPSGAIVKNMIAALAPSHGEVVVEIGAGHGELTRPLAAACQKSGAELVAIEKDQRLAERLQSEFESMPGIKIVSGDARRILEDDLEKNAGLKFIGNIPYYLTGHLLRIMSESRKWPARAVFMVQKEVAERMLAAPPRMNRLAASVQFWAKPRVIASVPKESFAPMPQVDSAVLLLEAKVAEGNDEHGENVNAAQTPRATPGQYYAAVRALFAQPRKTVLNNLTATIKSKSGGAGDKNTLAAELRALDIAPDARPQNLTITSIQAIAAALFQIESE